MLGPSHPEQMHGVRLFLVSAFDPEIFQDFLSWMTVIVMLSTGLCFEVYVQRYLVCW